MITFKKDIIALALTGALIGGVNFTARAQVAPSQSTTQTQSEITNAELTKFADAFIEVQEENKVAQQEVMGIIKNNGLEVDRFNEIQKSKMDPKATVDASKEELEQHAAVITEIKSMQPKLESKMFAIIKDHGLTMETYKAVAVALQNDKALQQKFQEIMMKSQTKG
ncbi:DUF4168 domain-containing protein [Leeuwenhoekiella sp. W20_SRS_FM14]|uniref:DUF4168 domain-containing protein n=1 Tax=Leeuwenhoekiella sp. W20_SRS_FM14 TaxID=3240270 RepID=UPI003F98BD81